VTHIQTGNEKYVTLNCTDPGVVEKMNYTQLEQLLPVSNNINPNKGIKIVLKLPNLRIPGVKHDSEKSVY